MNSTDQLLDLISNKDKYEKKLKELSAKSKLLDKKLSTIKNADQIDALHAAALSDSKKARNLLIEAKKEAADIVSTSKSVTDKQEKELQSKIDSLDQKLKEITKREADFETFRKIKMVELDKLSQSIRKEKETLDLERDHFNELTKTMLHQKEALDTFIKTMS